MVDHGRTSDKMGNYRRRYIMLYLGHIIANHGLKPSFYHGQTKVEHDLTVFISPGWPINAQHLIYNALTLIVTVNDSPNKTVS